MQSDGSPHFLRVPQERPMYHSTSSRRTSPSPCEELSGSSRGPSEIGSLTSTRNPMADWQIRTKRPLRGPVREEAGPTLKNYITPTGLQRLKDEHRFLLSRERPAVVEVVAWAASNGDRSENADYLYGITKTPSSGFPSNVTLLLPGRLRNPASSSLPHVADFNGIRHRWDLRDPQSGSPPRQVQS